MTKPSDKTKKKKFRRSVKGKSKVFYDKAKKGKHKCGLCGKVLSGVPHSKGTGKITKLSKTQKRPSVPFGGVLCSECRTRIIDEAVKIISKEKKENELDMKSKNYVIQTAEMMK